MMLSDYTETLEKKRKEISDWMKAKRSEVPIPIYGSVDVRDSGWKVAVVDANHFPAGFNNVSEENIEVHPLQRPHSAVPPWLPVGSHPVSYTHLTLPTTRYV